MKPFASVVVLIIVASLAGCRGTGKQQQPQPGAQLERRGEEIMVAGQLFHVGAPVVLWTDPGGYDAYRVERRFVPWEQASWAATTREGKEANTPNRYGVRESVLTDEELELVRGGGWPLELLQQKVDQFVIHYDVAGTSRQCFKVLHDMRNLSVQFMLDLDGTIYQTLDAKERAWHAGTANSRSVGIEIANMGAYGGNEFAPLDQWYKKDQDGNTIITIPQRLGDGGIRTPNFQGRPARNELIRGKVQGRELRQYDLTPQQYDSLIKLTAALCTIFPKLECDYPRLKSSYENQPQEKQQSPEAIARPGEQGKLIPHVLSDDQLREYQGLLGHYHVTTSKVDPGPAFQWDYVIREARKRMSEQAMAANARERGKPVQERPREPRRRIASSN